MICVHHLRVTGIVAHVFFMFARIKLSRLCTFEAINVMKGSFSALAYNSYAVNETTDLKLNLCCCIYTINNLMTLNSASQQ